MELKETVCYLNSNDGSGILAFGEKQRLRIDSQEALEQLQAFITENSNEYVFGYLSYDLKNEIENLSSSNASLRLSTNFSSLFQLPIKE